MWGRRTPGPGTVPARIRCAEPPRCPAIRTTRWLASTAAHRRRQTRAPPTRESMVLHLMCRTRRSTRPRMPRARATAAHCPPTLRSLVPRAGLPEISPRTSSVTARRTARPVWRASEPSWPLSANRIAAEAPTCAARAATAPSARYANPSPSVKRCVCRCVWLPTAATWLSRIHVHWKISVRTRAPAPIPRRRAPWSGPMAPRAASSRALARQARRAPARGVTFARKRPVPA